MSYENLMTNNVLHRSHGLIKNKSKNKSFCDVHTIELHKVAAACFLVLDLIFVFCLVFCVFAIKTTKFQLDLKFNY